MIRDREGHKIRIAMAENAHVLTYGKSGQGKTFFLCRRLEENVECGKKTLVVDHSGSFSPQELEEKGFLYREKVTHYKLYEQKMTWMLRVSDAKLFRHELSNALVEATGCNSYFQKKLLDEAIKNVLESNEKVNVLAIIEALEKMLLSEEDSGWLQENKDNLARLLTRLYPYKETENFFIAMGKTEDDKIRPVTIIDITKYPEQQRKFLSELIVSLFWREVYRQEFPNRCSVLLLDEMQFLSIKEGSSLSGMLREGRKKGVEVLLSTQYIHNYGKGEIQALQQVGNMVIFRPVPEDYHFSAQIIDPGNVKVWERELDRLRRGEAVLRGAYQIDSRCKVNYRPIFINIEK